METIRLSIWINAPAERCFSLATSAAFQRALARASLRAKSGETPGGMLGVGDRLLWPGSYLRMRLSYATRIDQIRPALFFREVADGGYFPHLEHEHYFTVLNDGTRVRDEVRFRAPAKGLLRPLSAPLLRRYLREQIARRNELLKEAAESEDWEDYLARASEESEEPERSKAAGSRNDSARGVAASHLAAHRS